VQQTNKLLEQAEAIELPALGGFIDGQVVVPTTERENQLRDPNTREAIQAQLSCDADQVETALASADAACQSGEWENCPAEQLYCPNAGGWLLAGCHTGRNLRPGGVKINGFNLLSLSGVPRGAWGLSGLGEEGANESIDFFTGARTVGVAPQDAVGGR